jgi:membrane associated rhomboid family serine protease
MTTKTFGRRGVGAQVASPLLRVNAPAAVPDVVLDQESNVPPPEETIGGRSLIADIPFLTGGMILFLLLVFGVERRLAFDIDKSGDLSVGSLIAFGAVSYDLVVVAGEWWRVSLAPLLHASYSHLFGNCFALLFVGVRLEPMIGRAWFPMIFVASALGGVAGSLLGNPPGLPSVGASGAITGLIGALFVVSFRRADPVEQRSMRRTSMWFGIPSLLPLAFAASGEVDYAAHAGGAIVGGAVGLVLNAVWHDDGRRPLLTRLAAIAAVMGLAASIVSCGIAATRYSTYGAKVAHLIPSSEMPSNLTKAGDQRSAKLLARYPKDPRSHLMRAFFLMRANRNSEAENELRATIALASSDPVGRATRDLAEAVLAALIVEQGRRGEAKALVADMCRAKDKATVRRILETAKLCD